MRKKKQQTQEVKDKSIEIGLAEGFSRSEQGIKPGPGSQWDYYFDYRNKDPEDHDVYCKSMYHKALKMEQLRIIQDCNGSASEEPKAFLDRLADEVRTRIKITQSEIFKVGEILVLAKKICQQIKIGFKDWISRQFDFSYETANNFMNVYTHCLGHRQAALKMKPSLLYKVSSPSFPDELREWLFEKGNLSKITNGQVKGLTEKFKQGGWEAVQDDVQELSHMGTRQDELVNRFDQFQDIMRRIYILTEKMDKNSGIDNFSHDIIMDLNKALIKAYQDLNTAKEQATAQFKIEFQRTLDKANDVTPLSAAS